MFFDKRLATPLALAGVALVAVVATGCLLRIAIGSEYYEDDLGEFIDNIFASVSTAYCTENSTFGTTECQYSLNGGTITSTAQLVSELGVVGIIIDPLILELPDTVQDIEGTYTDGDGNSGALLVYANLQTIPADDTRNFVASPGHQLVIVDLPSGVAIEGVDYSFSLGFRRPAPAGSPPTEIKGILTGRIDVGGKTYYPPFLPCTTDFASVPSFTLPQVASGSDPMQPISLPTNPQVCNDEPYFYFNAESTNAPCDLDNDTDVDFLDFVEIMRARNIDTSPGDPRDINDDGRINLNDARICVATCSRARCAV